MSQSPRWDDGWDINPEAGEMSPKRRYWWEDDWSVLCATVVLILLVMMTMTLLVGIYRGDIPYQTEVSPMRGQTPVTIEDVTRVTDPNFAPLSLPAESPVPVTYFAPLPTGGPDADHYWLCYQYQHLAGSVIRYGERLTGGDQPEMAHPLNTGEGRGK